MKILILTDYFYPHVGGGVEKVVLEISLRLKSNGHDVSVFTLNTTNAKNEEFFHGVRILRVSAFDLTRLIGLQSAVSLEAWFKARNMIKDFNPDIIHVHTIFFFTTIIGVLLKKRFQIPLVTTLHLGSIDYLKGLKGFFIKVFEKKIGKWIIENSDLVTAVSNNVKSYGVRLGMDTRKCVVIHNGVDLSYFRAKRSYSSNSHKVVFIGRLIHNKGPDILLDSVKLVVKKIPDVKFLIVGEGPLRKKLEDFTRKNKLSKNVIFLGRVEDVRPAMKECDIYVRPSLLDGMPLGVLESMAAGLPLIATKIAGTPEIITHGKTGILVKPEDARELAEAIFDLLMNSNRMQDLSRNALKFVKSGFSWDIITKKYEKCYVDTIQSKTKIGPSST